MFDWIKGFVGRWANLVPAEVRDLIHWTVHALAGVVYFVFGRVGAAWHDVFTAARWIESTAADLVGWIVTWIRWLVRVAVPALERLARALWQDAVNLATRLYHDALRAVADALNVARRLVDDAIRWVHDHVLAPLLAGIVQLRADLLKWGYAAWQLLTHPAQLAAVAGDALISWAEQQFWRLAGPVGTFALRIVWANLRRFIALVETVLAAVL